MPKPCQASSQYGDAPRLIFCPFIESFVGYCSWPFHMDDLT